MDDRKHGSMATLFGLGAAIAAGWWLRKFFQEQYEETNGISNGKVSEKELVRTVFGRYSQRAQDYYEQVKDEIDQELSDMKMSLNDIDLAKYRELVSDTVERVQQEQAVPVEFVSALRNYLMSDFRQVKQGAKGSAKRTVRKVKKATE
jgi:hypothetical protein